MSVWHVWWWLDFFFHRANKSFSLKLCVTQGEIEIINTRQGGWSTGRSTEWRNPAQRLGESRSIHAILPALISSPGLPGHQRMCYRAGMCYRSDHTCFLWSRLHPICNRSLDAADRRHFPCKTKRFSLNNKTHGGLKFLHQIEKRCLLDGNASLRIKHLRHTTRLTFQHARTLHRISSPW